jgi:hypothetical protein
MTGRQYEPTKLCGSLWGVVAWHQHYVNWKHLPRRAVFVHRTEEIVGRIYDASFSFQCFCLQTMIKRNSLKMAVLWDVAPSSLVDIGRRFGWVYCLRHQGDRPGISWISSARNAHSMNVFRHNLRVSHRHHSNEEGHNEQYRNSNITWLVLKLFNNAF